MSVRSLVIDRFEEDVAVLESESGASYMTSLGLLPDGAREGDWLRVSLEIDPDATGDARARVTALRAQILVDDDGGDFVL